VARATIAARHRRDSFGRARAVGGPRDVLNFFRFYFCSCRPARRGFLRKSTPLSVRNGGSIFNRIPAGHGTGHTIIFSLDRLA